VKLQVFNGGLSTRQAAHLLQVNDAVEYSNIDNESSVLKPVKKKANTGTVLEQWAHYFEAETTWVHSNIKRHYLEYQANLYYTEVNKIPKYFDGINHYLLGIAEPLAAPTVAVNPAGALTGVYTYVYTYYNSVKGIESQPSEVSTEITVSSQGIDLTGLPASLDPQVDQKRIYRVGGDITAFSLVDTIANSDTSYLDSLSDIAIDGRDLASVDYNQCPAGMKYLTEAYGIMFGVLGDKLYFSITGQFTYWPATNFIDFPVEITGIATVSLGIIVFTKYKAHIITGTSAATFSKRPFSGDQGCLSFDSIQYVKNTIIWISSDGICSIDGAFVKVLSKDKLGAVELNVKNSAFHNEVYYILKSDNVILAYDFRYGSILKNLSLSVTNLIVAEDKLYGYNLDSYFGLFKGNDNESFIYTSPELSDGSLTLRKTYKSIFIKSTGNITVKVLIDEVEQASKALTTSDAHEIKVKEAYKNGYKIQFNITGTGEVEEIDYTVGAFEK